MVLSCVLGSWGWRHPEWENDVFYPGDLPSDWRLSYYANEFDMVVVPASYWTSEGYGDEDWIDDVTEIFRFYIDWPFLQMSTQADYEKCAQYCQSLGHQLSAILVNLDIWNDLSSDQQQWFTEATNSFVVLTYSDTKLPESAAVSVAQFNEKKSTEHKNLLLLHSDAAETLRDLGGRLTQLMQSATDTENEEKILPIVLANQSVEIQRLQDIKTLLTLLVS